MNFVKAHYKNPWFVVCIISIPILFWLYPIATDIRGIKDHLLRIDEKTEVSDISSKEHDKEIVKTLATTDIMRQLEQIESAAKNVRQSLYTVEESDKKAVCGINYSLQKWEISVYEKNIYHLQLNDKVVISNKSYGEHRPSAIFQVVEVSNRKNDVEASTSIFMNEESAITLDIINAKQMGTFEVTLRMLPKHS